VLKKHPLLTFLFFGVVLYLISNRLDELLVYQGATVGIYVIAIASLILLTGYSGQVSLGHGALMAVGAYAAVLIRIHYNAPVWLTFVVAVLAAAVGGALFHQLKINSQFLVANKGSLLILDYHQLHSVKISLNINGISGSAGQQRLSLCIGSDMY
jgi:ABC-type branched-subunit amino acid transport system permease subunit